MITKTTHNRNWNKETHEASNSSIPSVWDLRDRPQSGCMHGESSFSVKDLVRWNWEKKKEVAYKRKRVQAQNFSFKYIRRRWTVKVTLVISAKQSFIYRASLVWTSPAHVSDPNRPHVSHHDITWNQETCSPERKSLVMQSTWPVPTPSWME